jgi:hypothetical protein
MSTLRAFFPVLAATVIAGPPLAAHHGRGATFDMKKQLTLKGTVSQVRWQNPHVLISIDLRSRRHRTSLHELPPRTVSISLTA